LHNTEHLISILIPALNEEAGIEKTISSIPRYKLHELGYSLEIIVIDGNSTDLTREIALQKGAQVIVEKRTGYGRAYKTGFDAANGEIIVTLDADGTYPVGLIPKYIQRLNEKNMDFITVNRFSEIEKGAMSLSHRFGNKILSSVMRLLYSIDVRDSQSGMWIMRSSFVNRINLKSDDMSLSEEIKIIAFKFFRSLELEGRYFKRTGTAKLDTIKHGWYNLVYLFHYKKQIKFAVIAPPPPEIFEIEPKIVKKEVR
jgi:glycosyltransferase involved in cell wall biosynthesis